MGEKDSQRLTTLTISGPRSGLSPLGKLFLTDDEVSPLDETALVTAVSIPSNVRLETSRLGPTMTGLTKSEDRRGMRLQSGREILSESDISSAKEGFPKAKARSAKAESESGSRLIP